MTIDREICFAEGLLLCTWFLLDITAFENSSLGTAIEFAGLYFMAVTAIYFLSFAVRKGKSIRELVKALWRSTYFDAMTTVALVLPWLPQALSVNPAPFSYVALALANVALVIGLFSKRDRTIAAAA